VCDATSKPLNVIARPKLSLRDIDGHVSQRLSVGGGLTGRASAAMAAAAERMRDDGDFSGLAVSLPIVEWLGR
jgi:hypothetical protein